MAFIYNLSDTWNDAATTWNGIKLAVTNTASSASSNLLNLTVTGASTASFVVDKNGNLALNGTVNKITFTAPATGATLTLADNSTFVTSGAYSSTFTFSGTTTLTFPTSGTVTALGNTTTGSGAIVLATSPTLVTPALGTPTSGNFSSGSFTWPTFNQNTTGTAANVTGVVAIANGGTGQTTANAAFNALAPSQGGNSGKYLTTDGSNTSWATNPLGTVTSVDVSGGSTGLSFSGGPITTSGTITMAGTLAVANGGTGITSFGSGVATWLGTPSSANLASAVTDETGSGPLVFATSPTFTSQVTLGTASSTRGTLVLSNTSANTVTLQSSNTTAANYTLTFPAAAPVNGYYLQTDVNGVLSWAAGGGGGGGSPGGSTTQVQYNNAGTFGGMPGFTFDGTATVSMGVASTTSGSLKLYNSASANSVSLASGNNTAAWTLTLPVDDGTSGQALTTDGSGNTTWTTIASGLTVGSTAISGGTSGRILYDNAGVLGELATTGTGNVVLATSPTLVTPILGTPQSGTLSSCTGLPISTGVSGLGANVATFLATPSSANLAAAVTDETGTGSLVFSNSPTFNDDITLGVASTATGVANFNGLTSGTVTLSVADAAGTWTMKLPTTGGTNGQVLTTNGSGVTSWSTPALGVTAASDTTTATALYPLFAAATTGSLSTIYTSNPKYNYTPSTGILSAVAVSSTNGISLNAMTIAADFTVPTNYNGGSFGPVTIDTGITVTVSSGSTYTVV